MAEARSVNLTIRVRPSEMRALKTVALRRGISYSDVLREHMQAEYERVMQPAEGGSMESKEESNVVDNPFEGFSTETTKARKATAPKTSPDFVSNYRSRAFKDEEAEAALVEMEREHTDAAALTTPFDVAHAIRAARAEGRREGEETGKRQAQVEQIRKMQDETEAVLTDLKSNTLSSYSDQQLAELLVEAARRLTRKAS